MCKEQYDAMKICHDPRRQKSEKNNHSVIHFPEILAKKVFYKIGFTNMQILGRVFFLFVEK